MATLQQFSIRIRNVANGVSGNADRVVRAVLLAAASTVVLRTPVDTGRARANWQARAGTPAVGTLPAPSTPGEGPNAALARAQAVAAAYRGNSELSLTNNLPYIGALNRGHSKQAPANFVQAAITVAVNKVRNSRLVR